MSAIFLPQSTSYAFKVGPFLDSTDGKTRKTGLTIAQADRLLSKAGGVYTQQATTGSLTHSAAGFYSMTLSTGDTDTLGALELDIDIATALAVRRVFNVVTVDTFNALNGSGNGLRANAVSINSLTASAIRLALAAGQMVPGTVDNTGFTPTSTVFEASDIATAGTDHYKSRSIIFTSGTLAGQGCSITAYSVVGGRGHFTVSALNAAPANGATFLIV